jgi:hypothetical protein
MRKCICWSHWTTGYSEHSFDIKYNKDTSKYGKYLDHQHEYSKRHYGNLKNNKQK